MYTESSIKTQLYGWIECSTQIQFQPRRLSGSMQAVQFLLMMHEATMATLLLIS
jgi:hypothetical protein